MIVSLLLSPVFLLISGLIGMLPVAFALPDWLNPCLDLLSTALWFFPGDVWALVIGNVMFWVVAKLAWSIIEWVYKKVPGVD